MQDLLCKMQLLASIPPEIYADVVYMGGLNGLYKEEELELRHREMEECSTCLQC